MHQGSFAFKPVQTPSAPEDPIHSLCGACVAEKMCTGQLKRPCQSDELF